MVTRNALDDGAMTQKMPVMTIERPFAFPASFIYSQA